MADGMSEKWKTEAFGGYWSITSVTGNVIASEIPFGNYADHIVAMHNDELDRVTAAVNLVEKRLRDGMLSSAEIVKVFRMGEECG